MKLLGKDKIKRYSFEFKLPLTIMKYFSLGGRHSIEVEFTLLTQQS